MLGWGGEKRSGGWAVKKLPEKMGTKWQYGQKLQKIFPRFLAGAAGPPAGAPPGGGGAPAAKEGTASEPKHSY